MNENEDWYHRFNSNIKDDDIYYYYGKKGYETTIKYEETDEEKLDKIDMSIIESYIRKKKLENINKK